MLNATVKHYNQEVDFFKSFLDPYMKYTSGLFESEEEDLGVATRRMLDAIIHAAALENDSRVLEVGPGWGALLKRVIERELDINYIGVSPSKMQNQYIQAFKSPAHSLHTGVFETWEYSGKPLEAIILIGSFCHLTDKLAQLKKMHNLLSDDGVVIIEDTFFITPQAYKVHANNSATRFVQEHIFGFAEILSLEEQLEQIEKSGLRVASMLEHSNSYKLTIRRWIKNLKEMNIEQYPNAKEYVKYMNVAQRGWCNTTHNQLLVLQKR